MRVPAANQDNVLEDWRAIHCGTGAGMGLGLVLATRQPVGVSPLPSAMASLRKNKATRSSKEDACTKLLVRIDFRKSAKQLDEQSKSLDCGGKSQVLA